MDLKNKTLAEIESAFEKAEKWDQLNNQQNELSKDEHDQQREHRKIVFRWFKNTGIAIVLTFSAIFLIQSFLGGFESQIITDSFAYITQPLALVLFVLIGVSSLIMVLYLFFPILVTFINEKVNTVSLSTEFLNSSSEAKLNFLAKIVLAISILIGLSFNAAKGQNYNCVAANAKKEVGVLEEKGINNYGKRIDYYRSICLNKTVSGKTDAWCGYFVGAMLKNCNINTSHVNFLGRARDYFADASKIVYRKNFKYGVIKPTIHRGYLVGYMFKSGAIGHIGIIESWRWDTNNFDAIEGNTSNLNSVYRDANRLDGVRLKRRSINTAYIVSRI